jgi:hypothetical protein
MMGELMLLPPVARRSGRRRIGVAVSAALHGAAVLLVIAASSAQLTPAPPRPAPTTRLTWTPPPRPVTVMPATVAATPIMYAGTPPAGRKPAAATSAAAPAPPPTGSASEWRDYLPRALAAQAKGVQAPAYTVQNLTPELISMLTSRGLAVLVVGRPPFRDAEQIEWHNGHTTGRAPLPAGWGQNVARRGLPLSDSWVTGVAIAAGDAVYLVPRPALDIGILAAQMRAADARHVPLDALACTRGRLVVESDDAVAFVIDTVDDEVKK